MTASLPIVPRPVDITDAGLFPNIADASAWLSSLPAEQREKLQAEWRGK